MFISPVALQILLGAKCGLISTTANILYTVKLRIKSTRLTVNQQLCYLVLPFTLILHPNTHSYDFKECACDVHVLRKWQGQFRI